MSMDLLWFTKDKRDMKTKMIQQQLISELQIGKKGTMSEIKYREKLYLIRFTEEMNQVQPHNQLIMNHQVQNVVEDSDNENYDNQECFDSEMNIEE